MNMRLVAGLVLSAGFGRAEVPVSAFSERAVGGWHESLAESVRLEPGLPLFGDGHDRIRAGSPGASEARPAAVESRMPMLVPAGEIDRKAIVSPDAQTDYKLVVKQPAVVPAPGAVRYFPTGRTDLIGRPEALTALIADLVGEERVGGASREPKPKR